MEFINCGGGRIVFSIDKETIIKIPYNEYGLIKNNKELELSKNDIECYAKVFKMENNCIYVEKLIDCSVFEKDFINKKININTEYLGILSMYKPDKFSYQVGFDSSGKLKYYDYGYTENACKRNSFAFNKDYMLPFFIEYYKQHPKIDILFCDWMKGKELSINECYKLSLKNKKQ